MKAGLTPTTYGKIEKGSHTLTSKLQAIADVFLVPIESVLVLGTQAPMSEFDTLVERKVREQIALLRQAQGGVGQTPTAAESNATWLAGARQRAEKSEPTRVTGKVKRRK